MANLSRGVSDAIEGGRADAITRGHHEITPLHVLHRLAKDRDGLLFPAMVESYGGAPTAAIRFANSISKQLDKLPQLSQNSAGRHNNVEPKITLAEIIMRAESKKRDVQGPIEVDDLICALLDDTIISGLMTKVGLKANRVKGLVKSLMSKTVYSGRYRTLKTLGRDMMQDIPLYDPNISRESTIDRTIMTLASRFYPNVMLIVDKGVEIDSTINGIVQRILEGNVPPVLIGSRIIDIDATALITNAKLNSDVEDKISFMMKELKESNGNVILHIRSFHLLFESRKLGANLLKPLLAGGGYKMITSTTSEEFKTYIEPESEIRRLFDEIWVEEFDVLTTELVLRCLKSEFEDYHKLSVDDVIFQVAANLSTHHIPGVQPEKAIRLVDKACTKLKMSLTQPDENMRIKLKQMIELIVFESEMNQDAFKFTEITDLKSELSLMSHNCLNDPNQLVSLLNKEPSSKVCQQQENDTEYWLELEDRIRKRLVGQDEAVKVVADAVIRSKVGFSRPDRPIGYFLFLGPTGVGKTQLAKSLAAELFGSESKIIRLDMSEYMEGHSAARIFGAPPGYVGYKGGGQLTEAIRKNPESVVLIDEIEKAHKDVVHFLLQLLHEGVLTDGRGCKADFTKSVIIITSNLGASLMLSKELTWERVGEKVMKEVGRFFNPELVNRFDEICLFRPLSLESLKAQPWIREVESRLVAKLGTGTSLKISEAAENFILQHSYDPLKGARPIRGSIEKLVVTQLSKMMVKKQLHKGCEILIDVSDGDNVTCSVRPSEFRPPDQ